MAMVGSNRLQNRWLQLYLPLAFVLAFLLFPLYCMLIVSLKTDADLLNTRLNPFLLYHATIGHYTYLFTNTDFVRYVWNTMVVTVGSTALTLFCSFLLGYALGLLHFRGGGFIG